MRLSAFFRCAIPGAIMLTVTGCSTVLHTDDVLAYQVSNPIYLDRYYQADWFEADQHKLEEITLRQSDGQLSRGLRLSVKGSQNTVVYYGGSPYREKSNDIDIMGQFAFLGLNVVTFKNRGIDNDGEWPSLAQLKQDAESVYDYVRKLYPDEFLIIHGTAMSSFWVADIATQQDVQALVLEGAVTTVQELVDENNKLAWLQKVDIADDLNALDNYQTLQAFDGPVLLLTAEDDADVPAELAERLYGTLPTMKKSIALVPNSDEQDLLLHDDSLAAYTMFIHKYGFE
ncbi:hypothetical protein [Photobacterium nomapromontoriensis]|uniref:hypothetical protein n=1 Tax=Photobacterium nomapromontoriensis TaxID=2910237 RepID=UPI003D11926D